MEPAVFRAADRGRPIRSCGHVSCSLQEQQKRNWLLSPQQAPTAAKRLGKRVRNKVSSLGKTAVRRLKHPMAGGDAESEGYSSSGSSDVSAIGTVVPSEDTEVGGRDR